ncbi:competence/damage-inducible protein cinA [Desulfotomaculum arcticum]|uniref:Putative competence-damage inducible protein n=1 Tax=Desulfotruncus arcticus DSM 17038 TaxID=1121424 RepID=A0A1I2YH92_9FIRM|nr:competence/damage-inducible protein A [Desulfotruncus arcticus]SFH25012.1 competence/damage-inducible protein cinA [Desulfotomaculum arcticum] [Desulfotruncus arcticus DSM 17038]
MIAEIIFTGTELLLGQILNTNAQYLQQELSAMGVDLFYQVTVGDNLERCATAIRQASKRADLIIICGGLGPTEDDISREALAEALQLQLVEDPFALTVVTRFFKERGVPVSSNNYKQALVPQGGIAVDNPVGTAPGIILEKDGKIYILVPGPPPEFAKMVREKIIPHLLDKMSERSGLIMSRVLKFCGIGEALIDEKLSDLIKSNNPTVAPTAKFAEVHLRITAKAKGPEQAQKMIDEMEARVRERLGSYIFGTNNETLPAVVINLISKKKMTVSIIEDFTGGQLAYQLSSAKGSGGVFKSGLVVTNLKAVELFKNLSWGSVPADLKQKAEYLAAAVRKKFDSDIGVAVTVLSDPEQKLAQTSHRFFMAADFNGVEMSREMLLWGDRDDAAQRATTVTLMLMWRYLKHGIKF